MNYTNFLKLQLTVEIHNKIQRFRSASLLFPQNKSNPNNVTECPQHNITAYTRTYTFQMQLTKVTFCQHLSRETVTSIKVFKHDISAPADAIKSKRS